MSMVGKLAKVGFTPGMLLSKRVPITNAEIITLRASAKEILPAPGADYFYEVVSFILILNYGSNVFTESTDNLALQYASGDDIMTIESTNLIDASADTISVNYPTSVVTNAAADLLNDAIELFNSGDGEFAGNAGEDTTMIAIINYRLHTADL